jgi:hypothetical protein
MGVTTKTSSTPVLANPVSASSALSIARPRFPVRRELDMPEPISRLKPLVRLSVPSKCSPPRAGRPTDIEQDAANGGRLVHQQHVPNGQPARNDRLLEVRSCPAFKRVAL